jgi:hypothetical protein
VLALGDRGEVDLAVRQWELGGRAEYRGGSLLKDGILLVLDGDLTGTGKKRVRPIERDSAEVVVNGIVGAAREQNAIDEQALRIRPDLHRSQHQRAAIAAPLRLRAHPNVIGCDGPL